MRTKETKGITLVALVITIVILLILAGVGLNMVLGENGIITKAKLAKQMSEVSNEKEAIQLDVTLAKMEEALDSKNKYYVGTTLYDKTLENGEKWDIIIINETKKQYGTNWCYIPQNTNIEGFGATTRNWLANYQTGEVEELSQEYTELSYKTSLAVTDSLAMNIDATDLSDENWGDIEKHGDVKYLSENKSLYFDGDGDYLEFTKNADFSNGFTFEIYANLERVEYNNGSPYIGMGIFCKMPLLTSNYTQAMRFGLTGDTICKFNVSSSWNGNGQEMSTTGGGHVMTNYRYATNQDFYVTFVYTRYNEKNPQWDEKADKIELYVDGKLYGYTYYGINSYNNGAKTWNNDQSHFFLGVCPWHQDGNLYYLKGNIYCTRLYERALSENEVKENVTKTELYRQTIK